MHYRLSIFINNLSFSNKLLCTIYSYLNESNMNTVWINRSIQRGHHIELHSQYLSDLKELENFLAEAFENYTPISIKKEKLKKQIMTVSIVENKEAELAIQPDGTTLLERIDSSKEGSSLSSIETELAIEKKKMELIFFLEKTGFFNKSESQQNILLTKLFLNLGLLFNNNLRIGYLSMKSNILFFNQQVKTLKKTVLQKKYEYYYQSVNFLSLEEQMFIDENIEVFLSENEKSYFKRFVVNLYQFFYQESKKGHLHYENLSSAVSFLQQAREKGDITEFHENFLLIKNFYHSIHLFPL